VFNDPLVDLRWNEIVTIVFAVGLLVGCSSGTELEDRHLDTNSSSATSCCVSPALHGLVVSIRGPEGGAS